MDTTYSKEVANTAPNVTKEVAYTSKEVANASSDCFDYTNNLIDNTQYVTGKLEHLDTNRRTVSGSVEYPWMLPRFITTYGS